MKIAIEAFALRNIKSGTGRYALDIISSLSQKHDVIVITREPDPEAFKILPSKVKVVLANSFRFIPANAYLYFFLGHFLKKYKFDFAIFLIGCRPLFFNKIYDLVVCDFNHKIFPKSVKFITRQIYRLSSFWSIKGCRNLITISEGTSIKSKKFYGREADLIVNPSLLKFKNLQPRVVNDIPKDFSIYVGAIEPRKNICNLLIAHEYAVDNGLISDKLLLISSQSWFEGEVKNLLGKMEHSILLNSIEEAELAWLYSRANRVYMTTFYEGYGMPAAEGQAFGANIICTDIMELREASKNRGIYVGTSSIDIYQGIGLSLKRDQSMKKREFDCTLDLYEKQVDSYLKRLSDQY